MKYKRTKKHHSVLIVFCIIVILFIGMGTGYAVLEGTFTIKGYALLLSKDTDKKIKRLNDVFAIVCDDSDNFATFNLSDGSVTVLSQAISEDSATIDYQINIKTGKPRTEVISFNIKNITNSTIKDGTFSYTVNPSSTTVINGTIVADIPATIAPSEVRSF
ncbi:MAG: hypothetical protein FWF46_05290 [Oscillospiraceae bacterium]|nr:hypothetical protein [Oscillospiraceae bacterium]